MVHMAGLANKQFILVQRMLIGQKDPRIVMGLQYRNIPQIYSRDRLPAQGPLGKWSNPHLDFW